jgi:putative hemolysin
MFLQHAIAAETIDLKYLSNGKYLDVKIVKIGKSKVSIDCQANTACTALKVANGKAFKIQLTSAPFVGNPGANYCWDIGAKNRILKDEKNNQYDFCVFEDGSMIDAWNLYSKHYPPARIK